MVTAVITSDRLIVLDDTGEPISSSDVSGISPGKARIASNGDGFLVLVFVPQNLL